MNKKTLFIVGTCVALIVALTLYHQRRHAWCGIKQDTLIVGTSADFQPFCYIQDDTIVGFDIDLINEIAHRLGKECLIVDHSFDTLISELQLGVIHVAAAGFSPWPSRAAIVDFALPHLEGEDLLIVSPKHVSIGTRPEDLRGKTIIVNDGYTADAKLSQDPRITLIRLGTVAEALLALRSGRADGFVSARNAIQPFLELHPHEFTIQVLQGITEQTALAISKKFPELTEKINTVLQELKEDGTLTHLKQKWNVV